MTSRQQICCALYFPLAAWASPLEPAQVVDALQPAWRAPMTLSADGQRVAYCVMQSSRKQPMLEEPCYRSQTGVFSESVGCDVYLADAQGKVLNLSQAQGSSFAPVFSPDGQKLAFVSDRDGAARLWLWEEGKLRRLSERIVWLGVGWNRPTWSQDGKSLIVTTLPPGLSVAQAARAESGQEPGVDDPRQLPVKVYDTRLPSAPSHSGRFQPVAELTQIPLSFEPPRCLAEKVLSCGYWASPNHRYLAYTQSEGRFEPLSQRISYRLKIIELASNTLICSSPAFPSDFGSAVSWSPDSQKLAYFTMPEVNNYQQTEVFQMDLKGQVRQLAVGPYFQQTRGPAWWNSDHLLLRNEAEVAVVSLQGSLRRLSCASTNWVLNAQDQPDLQGQRVRLSQTGGATELDLESGRQQALPLDSSGLATVSSHPDILFQLELGPSGHQIRVCNKNVTQLVHLFNPAFRPESLGQPRLLEYGELRAAMLLPPNYDPHKRYPVVFVIYGGDLGSRQLNSFGLGPGGCDNYHLLASRGYIVVRPDLPIERDPAAEIARNVERAVDAVIDQGYGDPSRLAVMGHSYGGYSTLAVITRCHRFRAAIARVGIGNLVNRYLRFDDGQASFLAYTETGQGKMGCTLWENPQRYLENSPVFALDQVQTPVLLVHGQKDNAAWVEETGQVFVGLQRLGKRATYLAYPGEGHWEGTWTREHQLDYCQRMLDFLSDCGVTP